MSFYPPPNQVPSLPQKQINNIIKIKIISVNIDIITDIGIEPIESEL
jgi:hypothetical protein